MFLSNVYRIQSISERKNHIKFKFYVMFQYKLYQNLYQPKPTLFKSFVSLSIKFDDSCETTGRKTAVNGSN